MASPSSEKREVKRKLSEEFQAVQTPKREREGQAASPSSGSVHKFYRLDYLFGKSSEKVAKQAVQPPTVAQQAAMVSLETPAPDSRAVALQGRNKGGRPKNSSTRSKTVSGVRKHRADPTAQAKLRLADRLKELQEQPGMSKHAARVRLGKEYGLSLGAVRNLEKPDRVARLHSFVHKREPGKHSLRRAGSHLAKSKMSSQAEGKRVAGPGSILGKKDWLRPIWLQTAVWGQTEEQNGHLLSLTDLMRDYVHRLRTAIETKEKLGEADSKELAAWRKKLVTLQTNMKQRNREAVKLAARASLRERICTQTQNMSEAELQKRLETAWRLYDSQLFKAAQPVVQADLEVRDREAWFIHRKQTVLTFSDQIPVWLKPPPGRMLVSVVRQERALQQRRVKRLRKKQAEQQEQQPAQQSIVPHTEEPVEAEVPQETAARDAGQAPRWRVSFIARQAIHGFFEPGRQPEGRVQPAILVIYGTHARLENISQSGHWLQSEQFEYAGQTVRREQGKKAPGTILRQWRQLREARPELFDDDTVRVWAQPAAVVDSVIYKWQQELESQEHRQAVDLIDSFVGGWTEQAGEAAFISQRLRSCVGAGTTGLTQLTDIALAQPAKAALARYHTDLRDQLREKARQENVAPTYKTGLAEILQAAREMQQHMVSLNEKRQTVVRGARSGGWLHYRPNEAGRLVPASLESWAADLPEGNAKLSQKMLAARGSWVQDGQPVPFAESDEADSQLLREGSYFVNSQHGVPEGIFLDWQPDFEISEAERLQIEDLLQHPRDRPGFFLLVAGPLIECCRP